MVFLCGSKSAQIFFILCLYMYCHWRSIYQKGEDCDSINWSNPATCLSMSQSRTYISNVIYVVVFCMLKWVEIRGDCSFYWYWWYYWPLLFKLPFHNSLKCILTQSNRHYTLKAYRYCWSKIIFRLYVGRDYYWFTETWMNQVQSRVMPRNVSITQRD